MIGALLAPTRRRRHHLLRRVRALLRGEPFSDGTLFTDGTGWL